MNAPTPTPTQNQAVANVGAAFSAGGNTGLNSAQQNAVQNVANAFSGKASPIATTPTVISSKDLSGSFQSNSDALAQKTAPVPSTTSTNGATGTTGTTSTESPTPSVDANGAVTTGNPLYDMIQQEAAQAKSQNEADAAQKKQDAQNLLQSNLAANDAVYAGQIQQVQATYSSLIDAQTRLDNLNTARTKAYGLANGNAMATPLEYTGAVSNVTQAGLDAIKKLDNERDALIGNAQAAQQQGDAKLLSDNMDKINQIEADMKTQAANLTKQFQDMYTQAQQAIKDEQAQQQLDAQKYLALNGLKYLDAWQSGDPNQQTAAVQRLMQESGGLVTASDAASYLQTAAGNATKATQDQLNLQKTQAEISQIPLDNELKQAQIAKLRQDIANSAPNLIDTPAADPTNAVNAGTDILSATGLSLPVFNYLTQGTSALSRLPAAQRNQIMTEAGNWAKANGVDVSTFQSQYKAYNDVLQKNIERANNTSIFANEVAGSADALTSVIDQKDMQPGFFGKLFGIGNFKPANLVSLATGKQVNDPLTTKYATQLQAMTNDYAGYLAASRGATSPEMSDINDAATIVANGLNSGSTQAFKQAIQTNEQKVNTVVNDAVTRTRGQVWGIFGVGDKFNAGAATGGQSTQSQQAYQVNGVTYVQGSDGLYYPQK